MTIDEFKGTLNSIEPPRHWSVQLRSLWYDAKGDWHTAHDLIDQLTDRASAHIHAYLHRVEGDHWNARYWYGRAKEPEFAGSLEDEWEALFYKFS